MLSVDALLIFFQAVDDLARKLSMPDFSLHDVEDHLERELVRDAVQPDTTTAV